MGLRPVLHWPMSGKSRIGPSPEPRCEPGGGVIFLRPGVWLASYADVMTTKFLLMTEPRWVGFLLHQEGEEVAHEFDSISEALQFARTLPSAEGAPFVVVDEKGKEFVSLTV